MSPAERILVFFFLSVLGGNFLNVQAQSSGKTKGQEAKPNVKAEAKAEAKPNVKAGAKPNVKAEAKPNVKAEAKADVKPSPIAGVRYDAAGHQDPFLNLLGIRTKREDAVVEAAAVPGIGGMRISEIAFVGTSLHEGTYTAVLRAKDNRTYFLREGERLRDGYVKKIQGDSVVFVQETRLRSGKVMTQEIAKQLRPS
jgi:hypothetical protein